MNRTLTSSEIAIIDENSSYLGVERKILMENAGAEVARFITQNEKELSSKLVIVFAGPGNNGGDACVVARHLAPYAKKIIVVLLSDEGKIKTNEARVNWDIVKNMKLTIECHLINKHVSPSELVNSLPRPDLIIDGIFGTGIKGEIKEPIKSVIEWINNSGATIYSIDVPSGMDPDTGQGKLYVKPMFTVTLHSKKPFMTMQHPEITGRVVVRPIGAPVESEFIAGPGDLKEVLRYPSTIKEVHIIGGAKELRNGVKQLAAKLNVRVIEGEVEKNEYELIVDEIVFTNIFEKAKSKDKSIYAYYAGMKENKIRIDYAEKLKRMSSKIGWTIYECGGPDYITDGKRLKMNWIEPPIPDEQYFGASLLISALFTSYGADVIYSLAGATFLVRKSIRELKQAFTFDDFSEVVAKQLKNYQ